MAPGLFLVYPVDMPRRSPSDYIRLSDEHCLGSLRPPTRFRATPLSGKCPVCKRRFRRNSDGNLRAHGRTR